MIVFKLYLNREPGYIITQESISTLLGEIDSLEPGNKLTIECTEMTKEQYEKLPEFAGW